MSAGFLRNGSKSYYSIRSLLQRHSIADSIGAPILRSQPRQQQPKAYARLPNSFYRKTKELELSAPSIFSSPSSSTSSSSSTIGFVGWYLGMIKSRPILTKSITSALIYTAADFSSQTIARPSSEPYDFVRTLRMAGYGMLILGPSLHFWFNFVSKILPKRDLVTTFKKIVMGQTLYGPVMTVVFFSQNAGLQGENGAEIIARLKRDLIPTMISGVMYWPFCDFVTFKFIPVHLQPLVSNSFSYLWTVYMTYMAGLEKAST
uniref:Putative Mpv17/PMP22 n=1 Tax=Davidia involucrata TaxID=16924 RepID=A0A5B7BGR7_DAVIN